MESALQEHRFIIPNNISIVTAQFDFEVLYVYKAT